MEEKNLTTMVRIGDVCFYISDDGVEDDYHLDFLMEERDFDERKQEEYIYSHCLATLTPDELEYLARRMLDAVKYKRVLIENNTPQER